MTKILGVKHVKQINETSCGAAALAMVYEYFNINQTQKEIWDRLAKTRQDNTGNVIYVSSIYEDATRQGLSYLGGQVVWENKSLALKVLKEFLDSGIPVIVNQLWKENSLYGHYRVVIGMDETNVIVQDPGNSLSEIEIIHKSFMHKWKKIANSVEVPGGVFIALFPNRMKDLVSKLELTLFNLTANISQFNASGFEFKNENSVKGGES